MRISAALRSLESCLVTYPDNRQLSRSMLAEVLGLNSEGVLQLSPDTELSAAQSADLESRISRLRSGEPVDYVIGHRAFRGLEFALSADVLIPRPETEQLVDMAIKAVGKANARILEIGTGSGCVSVTLFSELTADPAQRISLLGIDKSREALLVSRRNAEHLLHIELKEVVQSPLQLVSPDFSLINCGIKDLAAINNFTPDMIVSNPPYLTTEEMHLLPEAVAGFEPELALHGGTDGLAVYTEIRDYISELHHKPLLVLEISPGIATAVSDLFAEMYQQVTLVPDYFGRIRFLTATSARR